MAIEKKDDTTDINKELISVSAKFRRAAEMQSQALCSLREDPTALGVGNKG